MVKEGGGGVGLKAPFCEGAGAIESNADRSLKCCISPTVLESRLFFCAATTFGGGGVVAFESRLPLL